MDWKKTLATVAPTLATALGGPLAGMAVNIAAQALGVDNTEDSISAALATGNPDVLLKLKNAENNFKVELKKLDIESEKIAQLDRVSAREREAKVGDKVVPFLAVLTLSLFAYIVFYIMTHGFSGIPTEMVGIVGILIGQVGAKLEQVYNYYFGSSAGSRRKNDILTDAINKKPG